MKRLLLAAICGIAACSTYAPKADVTRLESLSKHKDFFKLRDELNAQKSVLNPETDLYYTALVDNAFNKNESSSIAVEELLKNYSDRLGDSTKVKLLTLQQDNYFKSFRYADAYQICRKALSEHHSSLDSNARESFETMAIIDSGLRTTPRQEVQILGETVINWKRNQLGVIDIPVRVKDSTYECTFDTRANISCIIESYAKKWNIKMLGVSYEEGSGITGKKFTSRLGVADSIYIGGILVRNAVFQVFPDSVLYFEPLHYGLSVIIGYPVIEQLKEVHILKNGTMKIPAKVTTDHVSNMAMDGLTPIITGVYDDDILNFQFDTGANSSTLYSNFYNRYKDKISKAGKMDSVYYGGAGGIVGMKIFKYDSMHLKIGDHIIKFGKTEVLINHESHIDTNFYGNLGQDLINQFDEIVINFERMFIDLK